MTLLLRLSVLAALAGPLRSSACTMFKITHQGKTLVGNNEDSWSLDPWIRFENGPAGAHGAVYVGHRNGWVQGGMNDAGLMFDGFGVPAKPMRSLPGRLPLGDIDALMKRILRECADVDDVERLLAAYDASGMRQGMIVFVDRAGRYLVLEGDTLLRGDDPTYVFGNFRPSQCTDLDAVPIARYQHGRAFLAIHRDTTLRSCTAVMDTMRACRVKLGEGTLYTNLFDLEKSTVLLYFYHDFTQWRSFDLRAELAKGDHTLDMAGLFPPNAEFQRLAHYRTPFNSRVLYGLLVACAVLALVTGAYMLIGLVAALWRKRPTLFPLRALLLTCGLLVLVLVPFLLWQEGIYYFGIEDGLHGPSLPWIAYTPLLMVLCGVLLVAIAYRRWKARTDGRLFRWMLTANAAMYVVLLGLFVYWDLLLLH